MECAAFWQPYVDWLDQPDKVTPAETTSPTLPFLIAGNRSEDNRFVLFMIGVFARRSTQVPGATPGEREITGFADQYFSDRLGQTNAATGGHQFLPGLQPFDAARLQPVQVNLILPAGPLQFLNNENNIVEASFGNFQCTNNDLMACTSEFDRSMIIMSLQKAWR